MVKKELVALVEHLLHDYATALEHWYSEFYAAEVYVPDIEEQIKAYQVSFDAQFKHIVEETFTIEEIKKYLMSKNSYGDIFYFLSAENIRKANQPKEEDDEVI